MKKLIAMTMCAFAVIAISKSLANSSNYPYLIKMFKVNTDAIPDASNYRRDWARITGFEHSGLHWDQFVVVFTNKGAKTYKHNYFQYITWYDDPEDEDNEPNYQSYPQGTVILKENFKIKNGTPDTPHTLAAMIKHAPGYDEAGGNWEYVQQDVDGNIILKGKGSDPVIKKTCADCHQNVADRDFIFANFYNNIKADKP